MKINNNSALLKQVMFIASIRHNVLPVITQ